MKTIVIRLDEYAEETNDPMEIRVAKTEGPRFNDDEGYFRVPRTGYVRNGVQYKLIGFGKLDKPPSSPIDLPYEAVSFLRARLGNAYAFQFERNYRLKAKLAQAIRLIGWEAVKNAFLDNVKEMKTMAALEMAVDAGPKNAPVQHEETFDAAPSMPAQDDVQGTSISLDDLENLLK